MSSSVTDARLQVPRKMVAASLRHDCKPVAVDWKPQIGAAVERALTLARISKQEASYQMGYPDQSAISRWIAGTERPQLDKLFAIEALQQALVIALAELAGTDVSTTIVVRRIA